MHLCYDEIETAKFEYVLIRDEVNWHWISSQVSKVATT